MREYYDLIDSDECVPAGFAVNPNVAVVLPMMLHEDEATAIERGIDGAHFFGYSLAHYYGMGDPSPGRTNVWEEFLENRDTKGFARDIVRPTRRRSAVKIMQQGLGSLRGAIGTPDQITDLLRRYEAAGVDQVIFVLQAGRQQARAHLRGARAVREQVLRVRRGARGARADKAERWRRRRARAGAPRAAARGPARLRDRRAGRAGARRTRRAPRPGARPRRVSSPTRCAALVERRGPGGDRAAGARRVATRSSSAASAARSPSARSSAAWRASSSRGSRSASRATSPTSSPTPATAAPARSLDCAREGRRRHGDARRQRRARRSRSSCGAGLRPPRSPRRSIRRS